MPLNRWAFGLVVFVCLGAIVWAYQETYLSLHKIWTENNHTYSHGYALLAFVCYALYTERNWLVHKPVFYLFPLGIAIGALWLAANAVQVLLIQQMLVPLMVLLIITAFVGVRASFHALLPVSALYLSIPVADFILDPLQDLTTFVISFFVRLSGITAFIEGYDIHLPYGVLRIADGCAGLNYLLAGLSIGLFYSYLNLTQKRHMLFAVALIVFLSLLGNWIRVYLLIMIGYYSEMQSSLVHEHGFFGWVTFAIFIVGYFFYMEYFVKRIGRAQRPSIEPFRPQIQGALAVILVTISLIAVPGYSHWSAADRQGNAVVKVQLPNPFSGFQRVDWSVAQRQGVRYSGADDLQAFDYRDENNVYTLAVSTYIHQAQGKELIYFANRPGRQLRASTELTLQDSIINIAIKQDQSGAVVWFYQIGEKQVTSGTQAKLAQLTQVFSDPLGASVVLHIDCLRRCDIQPQDLLSSSIVQGLANVEVTR
ncbi:exosortase [Alteromonas sp. ASW11-36]|uniref:Exosortase n=1 Tax=Alteromonas arenosi TaxID=3055817 RepID=A0ABT7STV8_9ALTE|nr:exosortase [Alteromonas sp. ASW11-36]MDM7859630.1 exosortase [Alteromonas sp. ASW11-36]